MTLGIIQFLLGTATGLLSGLALMLVFKKEFWKLAGAFYRNFMKENQMLQFEKNKWESLCKDEAWFKDREQYLKKMSAIQNKAVKLKEDELVIQMDKEELERKKDEQHNLYADYCVELDRRLTKIKESENDVD